MKKFFDWILTINLILIVGVALYLWVSGKLVVEYVGDQSVETIMSTEEEAVLFTNTLRSTVDEQLGQPVEGYTPDMFIEVFPGLVATDFEDVEASIGKYVVVEGQLVHVMPPSVPLHSAAAAVTSRGLRTLLDNVARRAQIDLSNSGTLTEVFDTLSQ